MKVIIIPGLPNMNWRINLSNLLEKLTLAQNKFNKSVLGVNTISVAFRTKKGNQPKWNQPERSRDDLPLKSRCGLRKTPQFSAWNCKAIPRNPSQPLLVLEQSFPCPELAKTRHGPTSHIKKLKDTTGLAEEDVQINLLLFPTPYSF